MTNSFHVQGQWILASGNTFVLKDQLKSLGARWRSADKTWVLSFSSTNIEELQKLGFFEKSNVTTQIEVDAENNIAGGVHSQSPAKILTVSAVNELLQKVIQKVLPDALWIEGEVSSLRIAKGHCYFELSDSQENQNSRMSASLSCCLWSGRRKILEDTYGELPLEESVKVRIQVRIEWRKEGGRISCILEDLDPNFSEGVLARERKALVAELKKRGLYEANRRAFLPKFALRLALITAQGSRAETDFLDELTQSKLAFRIVLFNCTMQGLNTSQEVSQALTYISENSEQFDAIVLTRGGGSRLDLRWFDDLEITKCIGKSILPVVSAIGHFEDLSVTDEVSFVSLKTPTAAASYFNQRTAQHFQELSKELETRAHNVAQRLVRLRSGLLQWKDRLENASKKRILKEHSQLLDFESRLNLTRRQLLSPLHRGYALMKKATEGENPKNAITLTPSEFITSPPQSLWLQMWDKHLGQEVYAHVKVLKIQE
jgi:exodeoxyribonuclease VII large subunit